jgi:soluble lytic murein transglycosylase-like protein
MRRQKMLKTTVLLLTLLVSNMALADVYKFIDNRGHTYYTDTPKNGLYKRIIKTVVSNYFKSSGLFKPTAYSGGYKSHFFGANKVKFNQLIEQAAIRHNVDAKLLHAVIQTESAYNSDAISPKGAVGLMQLMPGTARRFGVMDSNDPVQNVDGGARYLKYLLSLFGTNLPLAVAAYNAGENAVINHNHQIPPYPETVNYVRQVLTLYKN